MALPADDVTLWLELASGVVSCRDEPPAMSSADGSEYAPWFALSHADWTAAVVTLARLGPGAPADAETLSGYVTTFDFEADDTWDVDPEFDEPYDDGEWLDSDDAAAVEAGFATVELLWRMLGAVDEDARLTPLGWWGLPEALLHAWQPRSE